MPNKRDGASGRSMTRVADLPAGLRSVLGARDLIVFDGECVLCSGFFHFMHSHDSRGRFTYATAQSTLGQSLYRAMGLPTDDFETNLVIVDGRIHVKMDAFAAAMAALGAPWSLLAPVRHLPRLLKDPAYMAVARNRYRLFGRHDVCMLPDETLRVRFHPEGWNVA